MPSIFSRIISGEIPCYKLYEDEKTLCFLDINPMHPGHCLVIPKIEVDHWMDLPEEYATALTRTAQHMSHILKKTTKCQRVVSSILGFDVPHVHQHLIPVNSMNDYNWSFAKPAQQNDLEKMQQEICKNI